MEEEFSDIYFFGDKTFEVLPWLDALVFKSLSLAFAQQTSTVLHLISDQNTLLQGGNDYEIFMSPKTKGHTVTSPIDTIQQCTDLFIKPAKEALQC